VPFCPHCRGEYQSWVTRCIDCGDPLVDELPPPALTRKERREQEAATRRALAPLLPAPSVGLPHRARKEQEAAARRAEEAGLALTATKAALVLVVLLFGAVEWAAAFRAGESPAPGSSLDPQTTRGALPAAFVEVLLGAAVWKGCKWLLAKAGGAVAGEDEPLAGGRSGQAEAIVRRVEMIGLDRAR